MNEPARLLNLDTVAESDRVICREPTCRQVEVLAALVDGGIEYKVAAHSLGITTRTVKAHIAAARARAGCDSTLQLVAWCDDHIPKWRERRPAA